MGSLLCLQRWVLEFTMFEIPFAHCLFWIQIQGVPLEGISKDNAMKIGSKIGKVFTVEDPIVEKRITRGFMRVKVLIDITKPLVTGFWDPRKDFPKVWVMLLYEKLQDYCYNCGYIGHNQKDCKEEKDMSLIGKNVPRYGPGLGVSPMRPLPQYKRWSFNGKSDRRDGVGPHWYRSKMDDFADTPKNYQTDRQPQKAVMSEDVEGSFGDSGNAELLPPL